MQHRLRVTVSTGIRFSTHCRWFSCRKYCRGRTTMAKRGNNHRLICLFELLLINLAVCFLPEKRVMWSSVTSAGKDLSWLLRHNQVAKTSTSSFPNISVYTRPHENVTPEFSRVSVLGSVSKCANALKSKTTRRWEKRCKKIRVLKWKRSSVDVKKRCKCIHLSEMYMKSLVLPCATLLVATSENKIAKKGSNAENNFLMGINKGSSIIFIITRTLPVSVKHQEEAEWIPPCLGWFYGFRVHHDV